ncbi:GTP-binding protein [Phlyctema vagabunda]|uniref:GTP-binding protein n=1 Tax=Phlyctema vagabunda TaxID=108571 RepID=A0ABR4PN69_9HELO
MASIFTYDSVLQRVSSPWKTPSNSPIPSSPAKSNSEMVSRLDPEPQEGPVEYKLHLMLRPRRAYTSISTTSVLPASRLQKQRVGSQTRLSTKPGPIPPSAQSRQQRLEQLTTQLLWRLQQSSPYHASSKSIPIIPRLPEVDESGKISSRPSSLLAGLEQSRGALYEIGVSDDGTLVGLAPDEMEESLETIGAMATSLGCNVEVLRRIIVGHCEWEEAHETGSILGTAPELQRGVPNVLQVSKCEADLHVAEVLIMPNLGPENAILPSLSRLGMLSADESGEQPSKSSIQQPQSLFLGDSTEQLRVTITGPSKSGKSSLLGTLLTTNLDNGRGKSRVTSLKHPHELASGITSSVVHELIGYKERNVINYATGDVTTWTDIHAAADGGRLVCLTDSAGLPKYRRTTLRGLVGWDPHWLALCLGVGENDIGSSGAVHDTDGLGLGSGEDELDSAGVFLDLCLKLEKPLAIIITKYDLASKARLRQTLTNIYSAVKANKRTPSFIRRDLSEPSSDNLNTIPKTADECVQGALQPMITSMDFLSIVPIVVASATTGQGMQTLHSLLRNLPVPLPPTMHGFVGTSRLNPEQPASLFHIEDTYGVAASSLPLGTSINPVDLDGGVVVAGHLRFGSLAIGNTVMIGPSPANTNVFPLVQSRRRSARCSTAISGGLSSHDSTHDHYLRERESTDFENEPEWHVASIVSIRNLRLPVHTLHAGQVGTIGVVFQGVDISKSARLGPIRIRKTLQAVSRFTASFRDSDINSLSLTSGASVIVYIASIRAAARIVSLLPCDSLSIESLKSDEPSPDIFSLDGFELERDGQLRTELTMELLTSREWIELGSPILLIPNRATGMADRPEKGKGPLASLEGCVGRVTVVEE